MKTRIAELRKKAGLSQTQLAEKIGTKLSMIGKLERDERELTTSWIAKISEALNVSPGDLFDVSDFIIEDGYINADGSITLASADGANFLDFFHGAELFKEIEKSASKSSPRRGFSIEWHPVPISLPRDARVIIDVRQGGAPSSDLLGRLAIIAIGGEKESVLGMVMAGPDPTTMIVIPCGGRPREVQTVKQIYPVSEIRF